MVHKLFERISEEIWFRLRDTSKARIRQGEETITDIILLEILRSGNKFIEIIQTPKIKEIEKGTDWEWWIGTEELGWLRYAIQAKKLDPVSLNYKSLNYKTGKKPDQERQIDILKRYAMYNDAIPLYSFYNYIELEKSTDLREFWHKRIDEYQVEQFGWTCSPIENVLKLLDSKVRGNKKFESIHSQTDTFPIRYLLDPISFKSFLKDQKENNIRVVGYFESLPSFFRDTDSIVDRDNEKEADKRPDSNDNIAYKQMPQFSKFLTPRDFENNIIINNPEIISNEFYNQEIGLYPKRIMKLDIDKKE